MPTGERPVFQDEELHDIFHDMDVAWNRLVTTMLNRYGPPEEVGEHTYYLPYSILPLNLREAMRETYDATWLARARRIRATLLRHFGYSPRYHLGADVDEAAGNYIDQVAHAEAIKRVRNDPRFSAHYAAR
jgi:hypothetical protein